MCIENNISFAKYCNCITITNTTTNLLHFEFVSVLRYQCVKIVNRGKKILWKIFGLV